MKIRINTLFFDQDYSNLKLFGQRLQAYALQRFLKINFGFIDECLISGYKQDSNPINKCPLFKEFENEYLQVKSISSYEDYLDESIDKYIIAGDGIFMDNKLTANSTFLSEVNKIRKITYAASFNNEHNYKDYLIKKILKNFNHISLREESSISIFGRNNIGMRANLDPVFLLTKEQWQGIERKPDFIKDNEEFCVSFLNFYIKKDTNEIIEKEREGYKVYDLNDFNLPIGPREFIWMIRNAKKIFSGSYYAFCFSILFNKSFEFIALEEIRNNLTFKNLIRTLGLNYSKDKTLIDYNRIIKEITDCQISIAKMYLKDALTDLNYNEIEMEKCTGCFACMNRCRFGAIRRVEVNGFYYPEIDKNECVNCGECKTACPVLTQLNDKATNIRSKNNLTVKAFKSLDEDELKKSSSGGFFSFLSRYILNSTRHGIIFGVRYSEDFKSAYYSSSDKNIDSFRFPKFFENDDALVYKQVEGCIKFYEKAVKDEKEDLESYTSCILFTGRPCQVAGLYSYLDSKGYKHYRDILITCEVMCNGILSQVDWKRYLEDLERIYGSKVLNANQKSKKWGWIGSTLINFQDNSSFFQYNSKNKFLKNNHYRDCCFDCQFKFPNNKADITLGDISGKQIRSSIYDKRGLSLVILNNEKAIDIYNKAKEFSEGFYQEESIDIDKVIFAKREFSESRTRNEI